MASTLPPDPYKALGVLKDASISEIRSAYRKLVLKCHPDKVKDESLKAAKQDEFQQVQEAYELLSDDTKKLQYDEQVKLFELRKEMGRGNPRTNPFEYEIKTAEPRPGTYGRPAPKVYSYPTSVPKSHEDVYSGDPSYHMPRKSSSYEDKDRKRKDEEMKRRRDEEFRAAAHQKKFDEEIRMREKEKEREKRVHNEKKKSREKEKRRGTDEKRARATAYVEDDDSDEFDYQRSPSFRASERRTKQAEEEMYMRNEAAREAARAQERANIKEAPLATKWDSHKQSAEKYISTARRKASDPDEFLPPSLRRAETTFTPTSPPYHVRYASPSDDETPHRSRAGRRSSDTTARRKSSRDRERRSSPSHPNVNIVSPPSPPPVSSRKPSLQTHTSDPVFNKPSRAKTTEFTRDPPPHLPRAHTFQTGDTRESRRSGSKLKKESFPTDSDSDSQGFHSPRSPRKSEQTRYVVQDSRAIPIPSRHRSDLRDLGGDYARERSVSPGATASRPPLFRNHSSSGDHPSRNYSTAYYAGPEPPEPRIINVSSRPKMPPRESGAFRAAPKYVSPGFQNVSYGQKIDPSNIIYARHGEGLYSSPHGRHGREAEYHPSMRGGNGVYVS